MFQTVCVFMAQTIGGHHQAWFGVLLPYHKTTRKCEQKFGIAIFNGSMMRKESFLLSIIEFSSR